MYVYLCVYIDMCSYTCTQINENESVKIITTKKTNNRQTNKKTRRKSQFKCA